MRSSVIVGLVVVLAAILVFSRSILHGILWLIGAGIDVISEIASAIFHFVVYIAVLVPLWAITTTINILAALLPVAAILVVLLAIWGALWIILRQFAALASKLDGISADGKQAAIDTGFVAVLAAGAAAVAYVATDDFLDHFHTLKFLAVASLTSCIGKMSLLIPARLAKGVGIVMTTLAVIATIFYLFDHYTQINWAAVEATRAFAFVAIMFLFAAAAGYPFTLRGWRRLLTTPAASA